VSFPVHCRWRKLEGSDPSTYEMIQKIQTLQKRLIGKTEEVVEKDLLIQVGQSHSEPCQTSSRGCCRSSVCAHPGTHTMAASG
jgi:hypothetical protein